MITNLKSKEVKQDDMVSYRSLSEFYNSDLCLKTAQEFVTELYGEIEKRIKKNEDIEFNMK